MNSYSDKELQIKSVHYRKALLKYIKTANSGHTGGSLSCVDILNVLYNDVLNVLDHNTLQITGRTREVCSPYPIDEKFRAFGWSVMTTDGNNIGELRMAFRSMPVKPGSPSLIIANTVKGKGISFMEDGKKWHHGVPSDAQYEQAMAELEKELEKLSG